MSDTPRTDDQECDMFVGVSTFTPSDIQQAFDFARQLERELNAATSEVDRLRKANLQLREGAEEQKQRIKRLEEAGDEIEMILLQYASRAELPRTMAIEQSDLSKRLCVNWRKAKEDKL